MKFAYAISVAALLLCSTATAQRPLAGRTGGSPRPSAPNGTAAAADVQPGSLRGTVVSSTGEPLRKAEVSLRNSRGGDSRGPSGSMSATTDAGGNFAFAAVAPGTYVLSAQRPGYVRSDYSRSVSPSGFGRPAATPVEVAPGGSVSGLTIRMTPQSVITGKVTDEDGDPVMRASVQVIRERWVNGRRQQMPLSSDSTDDRGEYRIAGLMPGKYFLQVSASRPIMMHEAGQMRPAEGPGDQTYIPLFYPGVTELGQAQALSLAPGQEARGVDLSLRKANTWRIRGQVLDDAGKPMQYAGVMALPSEGGMLGARSMGMVRGGDGRFEISGLVPGSYTLVVNRGGRDDTRQSGRLAVTLGNRDLENLVIQMQRPFEIAGTVRVDGADGQTVPEGAMRVTLDPMESGLMFASGGGNGQVQADGSWSLGGVSAGKYRVTLPSVPAGFYLKAVRVGGQDITAGAQISAAATGVEIVLGAKAPEVSGTVIGADKQPVTSGTAFLVPDASRRDRPASYKFAVLAEGGTFRFTGVPPGDYTIYALTEVDEGAWFDPDFLRTLEGKGTAVRLTEGQTETVQVPLAQ